MTKNKIVIGGAMLMIIGIAIGYQGHQPTKNIPNNLDPIKIGYIGPLTGDAASYGEGEKNAITMALEDINTRGGINGHKLEMIYEDGKCAGQDAATAASKLVNIDQVKIILGGACSGETLAAAPVTEPAKVILFSSFSSNPTVSSAGDYVFRNTPPDTNMAYGAAILAAQERHEKIAILSENTDYAIGLKNNTTQKLTGLKKTIVANEIYESGTRDFRTVLSKIKNSGADALIVNAQSGIPAGLIVQQARALGIGTAIYGDNAFSSGDAFNAGGNSLNGIKFIDEPGINKNNPTAQKFLADYLARYPQPASEWGVGTRYDSVYIVANALRSCGPDDTDCIKNYLYTMPDYQGVIGEYHFDKNGDPVGLQSYTVKQIVDASKKLVTELSP